MKVQDTFRLERTKRRMSMQEVADKLGVSSMSICDTETLNRTKISTKTELFPKLCELYGLDPDKIKKQVMAQKYAEGIEKIKIQQEAGK